MWRKKKKTENNCNFDFNSIFKSNVSYRLIISISTNELLKALNVMFILTSIQLFTYTKYAILLILSKVSKTLCIANVRFVYITCFVVYLMCACVRLKAIKELLNIDKQDMRDEKLRSHWPKNNHRNRLICTNPFTP